MLKVKEDKQNIISYYWFIKCELSISRLKYHEDSICCRQEINLNIYMNQ